MSLYMFWDRTSNILVVHLDEEGGIDLPVALKFIRMDPANKHETIAVCPIWDRTVDYGERTVPSCVLSLPSDIDQLLIWPLFNPERPASAQAAKAFKAEVNLRDTLADETALALTQEYWSVDGNRDQPERVLSVVANPAEERKAELLGRPNSEVFVSRKQGKVCAPLQLASLAGRLPRVDIHVTPAQDVSDEPGPNVFDVHFEASFIPDTMTDDIKLDVWHSVASHHALRMINGEVVDASPFRFRVELGEAMQSSVCQMPLKSANDQAVLASFGILDRLVIEANQPVEMVFYNKDPIAPRSLDGFLVLTYYGGEFFVVDRGEFLHEVSRSSELRKHEPASKTWRPRHQEVAEVMGDDLLTREHKLPFIASFGVFQTLLQRGREVYFDLIELKPGSFDEFADAAAYYGLLLKEDFFRAAVEKPPKGHADQLSWLAEVNGLVIQEKLDNTSAEPTSENRDLWLEQFDGSPWDLTELLLCMDDVTDLVDLGIQIAPEGPSVFVSKYPDRKERLIDLNKNEGLLRSWGLVDPEKDDTKAELSSVQRLQERAEIASKNVHHLDEELHDLAQRSQIYVNAIPTDLPQLLIRKSRKPSGPLLEQAEKELEEAMQGTALSDLQKRISDKAVQMFLQQMAPQLDQISGALATLKERPQAEFAAGTDFAEDAGGAPLISQAMRHAITQIETVRSNFRLVNAIKHDVLKEIRAGQ